MASRYAEFRIESTIHFTRAALYYDTMETQLNQLKLEKTREIQDLLKEGRLASGFQEFYESDFELTFAKNFRYSYIVLLCLLMEDRFEYVCEHIYERRNLPLRARDLRNDTLGRFNLFLRKLANVPLDRFPEWEKLRDLVKIRNCIVHAAGSIKDSTDEVRLRNLVGKQPGLRLGRNDALIVEPEYCRAATDLVYDTLNRVLTEVWASDKERPND